MAVGDTHVLNSYSFRETLHGPMAEGACAGCGTKVMVDAAGSSVTSRCDRCARAHHGAALSYYGTKVDVPRPPVPAPASRNCLGCGTRLAPWLRDQGLEWHVTCGTEEPVAAPVTFAHPGGMSPEARQVRKELTEVIMWAAREDPRSQQVAVGASELGGECDRALAYRVAGMAAVNLYTDPWPATVGTAIHLWLEGAFRRFQEAAGAQRWLLEQTVHPDPLLRSHTDVFDTWDHMVLDWKTKGPKQMKKFQELGPTEKEKDQVSLYGKGQRAAGRRVEKVALVAVPRAGWLSDMEVWVGEYDESRAERALARMYAIAERCLELDVQAQPQRFEEIPAHPDQLCSWCPFYRGRDGDGRAADETGCPGR